MEDVTPAARARTHRPSGHIPAMAVAGAVDHAALRAAGWQLRGTLGALPYDDRLEADTYVEPAEVREDPRLDAVALDGADASLAALLPALVGDELQILLAGPAPVSVGLLADLLDRGAQESVTVTFTRRWDGWLHTVGTALPLGGTPVQVTVRGWPRGPAEAAELVDLVSSWSGEVVLAVAAPAPLPAPALATGERVAWALLTAAGATALVSHEGELAVHVSFPTARLLASPLVCRWQDGDRLPIAAPSVVLPPVPAGSTLGALATAVALARTVTGRPDPDLAAGTLGELFAAARVLEALRTSARTETPVRVD